MKELLQNMVVSAVIALSVMGCVRDESDNVRDITSKTVGKNTWICDVVSTYDIKHSEVSQTVKAKVRLNADTQPEAEKRAVAEIPMGQGTAWCSIEGGPLDPDPTPGGGTGPEVPPPPDPGATPDGVES